MKACLIIHGYTGGPYEVAPLADFLQEQTNWHIEVPTLPGHGDKLALENVTHEKWIEAAEERVKELEAQYDEVFLIGFSMGGMIAAYLAATYNIAKLVLLAPAGKYLAFKQIGRDIGDVLIDGVKGELEHNEIYLNYKRKMGEVPFKANLEFLKLVRFTRKYLNKVKSPVLIAQGQQDNMVPYKTPYYFDRHITSERKEVVLFERSRHCICLGEDKDTLNNITYSFLIENKETVKTE
ncbi:alpha/beta hydrolase [Oceanobacillus halotolerans]|uniref:alpha/beta hydrolase n=1 Tax=Oceanobacillus halotolerans TaxID=2663380 RepID=UPI0013DADA4D|nr:alpha/beta fold hydrolase [Oceanobacillus halotolerans]